MNDSAFQIHVFVIEDPVTKRAVFSAFTDTETVCREWFPSRSEAVAAAKDFVSMCEQDGAISEKLE